MSCVCKQNFGLIQNFQILPETPTGWSVSFKTIIHVWFLDKHFTHTVHATCIHYIFCNGCPVEVLLCTQQQLQAELSIPYSFFPLIRDDITVCPLLGLFSTIYLTLLRKKLTNNLF